jgi:PTH1 family peptidyl-tRNA hydrolase
VRLFRRGERASTLDLLVAGLGNPGREYEQTRHNAGWMVVDELARRHDGSFRSKFDGQLSEIRVGDLRLALLKPETYMNVSGKSISAAQRFFKVEPEQLLVVHDDVDLEPGRLQARDGGGLAGHNGLRSIAAALGTQDFLRLRIGASRTRIPGHGESHAQREGIRLKPASSSLPKNNNWMRCVCALGDQSRRKLSVQSS